MSDLLLREPSTLTVKKLHAAFSTKGVTSINVMTEGINVDAEGEHTIGGKDHDGNSWETTLGEASLGHLASWLDIPRPFLVKQTPDVQQFLLSTLLARKPGEIAIDITEGGIQDIRPAGRERMDPRIAIDVAAKVVGADAPVISSFRDLKEYRFDVVVKDGSEFQGGDAKVNDITKGGLRFGQDTQHRLAPWVNTFLYRLVCTNGMEVAAATEHKVTLKGKSMAEVRVALEEAALTQMALVNNQITAFYDMRTKKVDDPYQLVRRLSREGRYPARVLSALEDRMPIAIPDQSDATMFDVVNLITNMANHPDLLDRPNARRDLEAAGGVVIQDHIDRCPRCASAI